MRKMLRNCQRTIFILTIIATLQFIYICNLRHDIKKHECEVPVVQAASAVEPSPVAEVVVEEPKLTSLGEYRLTAYCACFECCGKHPDDVGYGITKSGVRAVQGVTVAADPTFIPLGTNISIDGLGEYIVQDTGSAIKGNKIDVYFEDHMEAKRFGVQRREVFVKGDL